VAIIEALSRGRLLAVLMLSAGLVGCGSPAAFAAASAATSTTSSSPATSQNRATAAGDGSTASLRVPGTVYVTAACATPYRVARRGRIVRAAGGSERPTNRGRELVTWLVLAAAALLLLTVAGFSRLRQIRWARRVAAHVR